VASFLGALRCQSSWPILTVGVYFVNTPLRGVKRVYNQIFRLDTGVVRTTRKSTGRDSWAPFAKRKLVGSAFPNSAAQVQVRELDADPHRPGEPAADFIPPLSEATCGAGAS